MGSAPVHSSVKVGDEKKKPRSTSMDFSFRPRIQAGFLLRRTKKKPGRGAIESGRESNPTGIALIACDCDECRTPTREHGLHAVKLQASPYSELFFFFPFLPCPRELRAAWLAASSMPAWIPRPRCGRRLSARRTRSATSCCACSGPTQYLD